MKKVYLVGAGPGNPELITVKGLKCIQKADVILYDRLVHPDLLKEAQIGATLVFCGKLPSLHLKKQEEINELLVKYANSDKVVVRLKGGDPFVFGRGAEEAQVLLENGIGYEVVPGLTAGTAVPASSNIPVTHRSLSRSFAIVTGHQRDGKPDDINWEHLVKGVDTLAVYMGIGNLSYIRKQLVDNGKAKNTPVAVIQAGTISGSKSVIGTLDVIADKVQQEGMKNPAIIIIGEVVRIKNQLEQLQQAASALEKERFTEML